LLELVKYKSIVRECRRPGGKYNDFEPFTLDEFQRHIGLYLVQALSPSPQVEMKFHSQLSDPVNGNDFVYNSFGGVAWKSERQHKHFKCFFSSQNPTLTVPSRESNPNWKVSYFNFCFVIIEFEFDSHWCSISQIKS
jgi:hypothetical protein